jgi:hypothetical protein
MNALPGIEMPNDKVIDEFYAGTIKMAVFAVKLRNAGMPREEIIRRLRIAERMDGKNTELYGLSERIAELAIDRWEEPL